MDAKTKFEIEMQKLDAFRSMARDMTALAHHSLQIRRVLERMEAKPTLAEAQAEPEIPEATKTLLETLIRTV